MGPEVSPVMPGLKREDDFCDDHTGFFEFYERNLGEPGFAEEG